MFLSEELDGTTWGEDMEDVDAAVEVILVAKDKRIVRATALLYEGGLDHGFSSWTKGTLP